MSVSHKTRETFILNIIQFSLSTACVVRVPINLHQSKSPFTTIRGLKIPVLIHVRVNFKKDRRICISSRYSSKLEKLGALLAIPNDRGADSKKVSARRPGWKKGLTRV